MDKYKVPYMNAVVRTFAKRKDMDLVTAFRYLYAYKGMEALDEFYEVEHLSSLDDAVDDLTILCQRNGGTVQ